MADNKRKEFAAEDYDPVNLDIWDGNAVKNALDDNIKNILKKEYEYSEDFRLVDQRLVICTLACFFSAFAVGYDYFYPFPESKYVLATCSITYFILMGVFQLFTSYRERNVFMLGVKKGIAGLGPDNYLYASSSLPRFSHMYKLSFKFCNGKTKEEFSTSFERSIAEWFDETGTLLIERLYNDVSQLHSKLKNKKQD